MNKKKIVAALLTCTLVGGLVLSGCGSTGTTASNTEATKAETTANAETTAKGTEKAPGEPATISFMGWGDAQEKEVFTKLCSDFEAKNADIKVKYTQVPADYVGKMNTMIAGGTAPDVLYVPDGDFGRWVKAGALASIQAYVDKSSLDTADMWDSALLRYRFNGKLTGEGEVYCLPKDIGPTVIYYNKDLFQKSNVPFPPSDRAMTFAELLDTAQKLTVDDNKDGKPEQYGMGPIWYEGFVYANGGEVLSADSKEWVMNGPEAVEIMQFGADLRNKYKVSPDSRALQSMNDGQLFETGKLAMIVQGRWMVPTYRKLKFDWDVTLIPAGKSGKSGGTSGSVGIGISAKSKYADQAYKLVEYLGGPEGQKLQSEMGFAIPSFKTMANSDVFLQPGQKPEHAQVFIEAAQLERPGPWTKLPNTKWCDIVNQNLGKLWDGKVTAKQLLDELKPQVDAAIKEGNPDVFK